jgi:hypothetical protein
MSDSELRAIVPYLFPMRNRKCPIEAFENGTSSDGLRLEDRWHPTSDPTASPNLA